MRLPCAVCCLGLIVAAYLAFVARYFQTQGRYLYPAMSAIATILALGWMAALPERYRRSGVFGLLGLMALLCIVYLIQTSGRL